MHDDQARRLGAALADGIERTHAQGFDLLLVEDFDFQVLELFAQILRLFTKEGRVADVRRQVAQVAGECHAVGDRGSVIHRALHFGLSSLDGQQGDFLQGARFGFLALELVEGVFAIHQGFCQQTGFAVAVAVFDNDFIQCQHGVAAAQTFQGVKDAGNDFTEWTVAQFLILAHADQQHALGFQVRQAVQQQALTDFTSQIATLEDGADRATAQFVDLFGGDTEFAAFADGNHQGGGFQRFWANAFYNQFHVRIPE
ncbi:hypothetical protein D3C87_991620 [compost metagenome]